MTLVTVCVSVVFVTASAICAEGRVQDLPHEEVTSDDWRPFSRLPISVRHCEPWAREGFKSIQVNVDAHGCNISGDAANEPSIAIDPTDPRRIVVGWRQFDNAGSAFRQAGWAYSHDSGFSWTSPGVLRPGVFGSDPVLGADADGNIYYYSIDSVDYSYSCSLHKSSDGGVSWRAPVSAFGYDKPWMTVDRTDGPGRNHVYCLWQWGLTRSTDRGHSFELPVELQDASWPTTTVAPDGTLYVASTYGLVLRSTNAKFKDETPIIDALGYVDMELPSSFESEDCPIDGGPNPQGLLRQMWIDADHSNGPSRGNLYMLSSWYPNGDDPMDVAFVRSSDGGLTWSTPIRVNDDPPSACSWQWFAMMSVAPNGRIDAIWNDTRNSGQPNISELYYSYSIDAGDTWSSNVPVSPMFDSWVGWPGGQMKIGDYYHMISDNLGVNVAYAATFNGEQDIYFLRIGPWDCNGNRMPDLNEIANATSSDCNLNGRPDECERDCNHNHVPDDCDLQSNPLADANADGHLDACAILYVDQKAPSVAGDGFSWQTALPDLQGALDVARRAAGAVREIWVASGNYTPARHHGDRSNTFRAVPDVAMYGGFAGYERNRSQRDVVLNRTVLTGDLNGDDGPDFENYQENSYGIVTASGADGLKVIDGFIITGGNADDLEELYFHRGAVHNRSGILHMQNCTISENLTGRGSAVASEGGSLVLENSVLARNDTTTYPDFGSALDAAESEVTIRRCLISDNSPDWHQTPIALVESGQLFVSESAFVGNGGPLSIYRSPRTSIVASLFAESFGGIDAHEIVSLEIDRCVFRGIQSYTFELLNCSYSRAVVSNSMFFENLLAIRFNHCDSAGLVNSTIAANTAFGDDLIRSYDSSVSVQNCIVWDNRDSAGNLLDSLIWADTRSSVVVDYSIVQGWNGAWPGFETFSGDPLFVNPLGADGVPGTHDDDFRLAPGSPAINSGQPGTINLPMDLDAHARLLCGNTDRGAYEFGIGDYDCDYRVSIMDAVAFPDCLVGPDANCDANECEPFDFDGDRDVDLRDLADFELLLKGFSPPPRITLDATP